MSQRQITSDRTIQWVIDQDDDMKPEIPKSPVEGRTPAASGLAGSFSNQILRQKTPSPPRGLTMARSYPGQRCDISLDNILELQDDSQESGAADHGTDDEEITSSDTSEEPDLQIRPRMLREHSRSRHDIDTDDEDAKHVNIDDENVDDVEMDLISDTTNGTDASGSRLVELMGTRFLRSDGEILRVAKELNKERKKFVPVKRAYRDGYDRVTRLEDKLEYLQRHRRA